ncbi:electron transport complex subunit RsxC [Shewanella sp. 125m-7]
MLTLLEQIDKGTLWRSHGGVHPSELKTLSNQTRIGKLPLANQYILPLTQVGDSALLAVKVGERVLKGQSLTTGTSFSYSPVHAPTSGTVTVIKPMPSNHASGIAVLSCIIEPDGLEEALQVTPADPLKLTNQEILHKIQQAGIAGLGGAAFPTHIKLSPASEIELVIINGIECEPYITSDDRLMREHSDEILAGIAIIEKLLNPKRIIIAIEDNKPDAIDAMQHALNRSGIAANSARITAVPTKYPSGGEKQLIQILTGQEVPSGAIPAQLGMLVQNVGTAYAIQDAVINGNALTQRVVTVTGLNSQTPGNYWLPIGTPITHILDSLGFSGDLAKDEVIIGGPMMGHSLPDVQAPVLKGTNCVLLPSREEIADDTEEKPCIRCGECAVVCPALLLPQQLFWHAKAEEYDKAASFNLHDCIECGCCSFVCPSDIPLVEYYRIAKSAIRTQTEEKKQADFAKQRFEARLQRLEEEKRAREAKAKEAAERRKSTMSNTDNNAVAEAMARIKAKKAAEMAQADAPVEGKELAEVTTLVDKKAQVAAAIARAKAKKDKQSSELSLSAEPQGDANKVDAAPVSTAPIDDKKAQVAAAIARAKAKKAVQTGADSQATVLASSIENDAAPIDDKKAKIAAAIARAKAKKAVQTGADSQATHLSSSIESDAAPIDDKKAKVAAAIARAKAKKAVQTGADSQATLLSSIESDAAPLDDKKAKIAAAIARAKAKKTVQTGADSQATDLSSSIESDAAPLDDKKAKIAAAIARAKAKKAVQTGADSQATHLTSSIENDAAPLDDKKAKIAAAIARAKAKKAVQTGADSQATVLTSSIENDAAPLDEKKAKIAAAIARAKAKKAVQTGADSQATAVDAATDLTSCIENDAADKPNVDAVEVIESATAQAERQEMTVEQRKKERIAATIAKAKAKKAQAQLQEKE